MGGDIPYPIKIPKNIHLTTASRLTPNNKSVLQSQQCPTVSAPTTTAGVEEKNITVLFGPTACLDPIQLFREARRLGLPTSHWYGKPNKYVCPRGRDFGWGWVLLTKKDADQIDTSVSQTLTFSAGSSSDETLDESIRIENLWVLRATILYPDSNSPTDDCACLVHFVDERYFFNLAPINLRSRDTWYQLHTLIWDEMVFPDTARSLPSAYPFGTHTTYPSGQPDHELVYVGISAWEAYNSVLAQTHRGLIYNPAPSDIPVGGDDTYYTIFQYDQPSKTVGDKDTLTVLSTFDDQEEDNFPETKDQAWPEKLRVFFPREEQHKSPEETFTSTESWSEEIAYTVDVDFNNASGIPGTILPVWDKTTAVYDTSGSLTNSAALQTQAESVASELWESLKTEELLRFQRRVGIKTNLFLCKTIGTISWGDTGHGPFTEVQSKVQPFPSKERIGIHRTSVGSQKPPFNTERRWLWPLGDHNESGSRLIPQDTHLRCITAEQMSRPCERIEEFSIKLGMATRIKAMSLSGTTENAVPRQGFTADKVVPLNGSSPVASSTETVSILDIHGFGIDAGSVVEAYYCFAKKRWELQQAECIDPIGPY